MIRVLQVVGNMDCGGVEPLLIMLYGSFDRDEVQFDFLCHDNILGKYNPEIIELRGHIYRIPGLGASSLFRYQRNLKGVFARSLQHKIVHSHLSRMNGVVLREAHRSEVPVRVSQTDAHNSYYDLLCNVLRSCSRRPIAQHATHGLACSADAAAFFHKGSLTETTKILPNAIETTKFNFATERRLVKRDELGLDDSFVQGGWHRCSPNLFPARLNPQIPTMGL